MTYKEPTLLPPSKSTKVDNLFGSFTMVSAAPTWTPKRFVDGFAIYSNSTTYRLYVYDFTGNAWRYVALS